LESTLAEERKKNGDLISEIKSANDKLKEDMQKTLGIT
jgi:hypothetical protein